MKKMFWSESRFATHTRGYFDNAKVFNNSRGCITNAFEGTARSRAIPRYSRASSGSERVSRTLSPRSWWCRSPARKARPLTGPRYTFSRSGSLDRSAHIYTPSPSRVLRTNRSPSSLPRQSRSLGPPPPATPRFTRRLSFPDPRPPRIYPTDSLIL